RRSRLSPGTGRKNTRRSFLRPVPGLANAARLLPTAVRRGLLSFALRALRAGCLPALRAGCQSAAPTRILDPLFHFLGTMPRVSSMVRNWLADTLANCWRAPEGHSTSTDAVAAFPSPKVNARSLAEQ